MRMYWLVFCVRGQALSGGGVPSARCHGPSLQGDRVVCPLPSLHPIRCTSYLTSEAEVDFTDFTACPALATRACKALRPAAAMASCGVYDDDPVVANGVKRVFHFFACLTPAEKRPFDKASMRDMPWCDISGIWGELLCLQMSPEGGACRRPGAEGVWECGTRRPGGSAGFLSCFAAVANQLLCCVAPSLRPAAALRGWRSLLCCVRRGLRARSADRMHVHCTVYRGCPAGPACEMLAVPPRLPWVAVRACECVGSCCRRRSDVHLLEAQECQRSYHASGDGGPAPQQPRSQRDPGCGQRGLAVLPPPHAARARVQVLQREYQCECGWGSVVSWGGGVVPHPFALLCCVDCAWLLLGCVLLLTAGVPGPALYVCKRRGCTRGPGRPLWTRWASWNNVDGGGSRGDLGWPYNKARILWRRLPACRPRTGSAVPCPAQYHA